MIRNLRGAYMNFTHDRPQDWEWLAQWQPNVIRLMLPGSHSDPASVDVNRIRRVYETCPDATILLRVWDVDDRNFEAHTAMVANPIAEADKQINWWARLFDRVPGVPRDKLMAGLNNETGPEKDAKLYPYTERALTRATTAGVSLGVFVFSVGRPGLAGESEYDIPRFARLESLIAANKGAVVLHEYMQPEGMYGVWTDEQGNERRDYTYLIGRHTRWPLSPAVPVIIGEWGIDGILYNRHPDPVYGNSGWRNFKDLWPPSRYADEYVECIRKASDNVIGICPFISDFADQKWQSFDLIDAYEELLKRKDLCVKEVASKPIETRLPQINRSPTPAQPPGFVTVVSGVNLRAAPNTSSPILDAIPYGEQVRILGVEQDGWLRVRYGSVEGYAAAQYIGLQSPEPLPAPAPATPPAPASPANEQAAWARSIAFVRKWEGGWADNPNDPGGATNKGITIGTYTRWRASRGQPAPTKEDLRNISDAETNQIYYEWYWVESGANRLSWPLCLATFDLAVNGGVGRAKEALDASQGNFILFMSWRLDWYTRITNFEYFGKAWIRRCADLMLEASR